MTGRPVARMVSSVLARIGLLGAVAGLVAISGMIASAIAVTGLTGGLQPAAAANRAIYQELTDMSAAVESWSGAGVSAAADRYHQAALRLAAHQTEVRAYAADDGPLATAIRRQEEAARAWIRTYAKPRLDARPGSGVSRREARAGIAAFDAFRTAHQEAARAFDGRVRSASDGVAIRLRGTVLVVILVSVGTAVLMARSGRRLLGELSTPLIALERAVQRMARGDHEVRAEASGPKEVQAVARALNDLADAQDRAREVEVWIQRELRTLDTAKDDFVANVSHELRTPLTTINGYLEMVAEEFEGQMEPRHERMLDATRRNVARLRLLIDDLLTLQRVEGSAQHPEPVDLSALIREVAMDVKITAARRGIQVGVHTPESAVPVLADRALLHRAFLNVMTNAVKFSRDEGVVDVVVTAGRGQAEVVITDRGIGIPAAELDGLGTRFFRASNAIINEIAGTGLGVRIMQTIIDRHGGAVVFDSEEGVGTTAHVRLPVHGGAPRLELLERPERVLEGVSTPESAP